MQELFDDMEIQQCGTQYYYIYHTCIQHVGYYHRRWNKGLAIYFVILITCSWELGHVEKLGFSLWNDTRDTHRSTRVRQQNT